MTRTIILIFASLLIPSISASQDRALDVCALLKSAKKYDGKTVLVTGFIRATQHSTAIGSEGCSGVVVVLYQTESQPQGFVSGVEDKRLKLDPRPFRVTLKGRFDRRVRAPLGYVSRIKVDSVLSADFVSDKTTVASPPVNRPQ